MFSGTEEEVEGGGRGWKEERSSVSSLFLSLSPNLLLSFFLLPWLASREEPAGAGVDGAESGSAMPERSVGKERTLF